MNFKIRNWKDIAVVAFIIASSPFLEEFISLLTRKISREELILKLKKEKILLLSCISSILFVLFLVGILIF